jgi:hypothetical protein
MTYNISGGAVVTKWTALAGSTATDILDLGKRVVVLSVIAEGTTGTPTLTIDVNDGTNTYDVRRAASVPFSFDEPFALDTNQKLRATSSDSSGHIHVAVSYINPTATAVGRA